MLMAHGQQTLHFPCLHRPVFEIEPDGIKPTLGGMADIERQVVTQGDNSRTLAVADFLQNFARSQTSTLSLGVIWQCHKIRYSGLS
jgi:hypothetical protein